MEFFLIEYAFREFSDKFSFSAKPVLRQPAKRNWVPVPVFEHSRYWSEQKKGWINTCVNWLVYKHDKKKRNKIILIVTSYICCYSRSFTTKNIPHKTKSSNSCCKSSVLIPCDELCWKFPSFILCECEWKPVFAGKLLSRTFDWWFDDTPFDGYISV